jgi:hypothetical protein
VVGRAGVVEAQDAAEIVDMRRAGFAVAVEIDVGEAVIGDGGVSGRACAVEIDGGGAVVEDGCIARARPGVEVDVLLLKMLALPALALA